MKILELLAPTLAALAFLALLGLVGADDMKMEQMAREAARQIQMEQQR